MESIRELMQALAISLTYEVVRAVLDSLLVSTVLEEIVFMQLM